MKSWRGRTIQMKDDASKIESWHDIHMSDFHFDQKRATLGNCQWVGILISACQECRLFQQLRLQTLGSHEAMPAAGHERLPLGKATASRWSAILLPGSPGCEGTPRIDLWFKHVYNTCSRLYCDLFDIYIQLNKCCYHLAPSSTTLVTASLSYWRALRCPRQVSTWRLMQLVHVRIRPVKTTRTRDPNATAKSNRLLPFFRCSYHFLSLSRPSYLCLKIQTCASSVPFTAIHIPLYGCTRMHISWKEFDKVGAPLQLVFFERNVQPSLLQLIFPVLLGAHRLIATKHRLL